MRGCFTFGRFKIVLGSLLLVVAGMTLAVGTVNGWQVGPEVPALAQRQPGKNAPLLDVTAELVEIGESRGDAEGPQVSLPPRLPPPRVRPVEEIISAEPIGNSSRRAPRSATAEPAIIATDDNADSPALKACVFQGAEPGVTSLAALKQLWGEPAVESKTPNGPVLTYTARPFSRIDAAFYEGTLHSITIHLGKPTPVDDLVKLLRLSNIQPVELVSPADQTFGRMFPERGLTLSFADDAAQREVTHVTMKALSAESFLLRAKNDHLHRWTQNLEDIEKALAIDKDDPRIWWLKAEILAHQCEFKNAALAIERAITLDADSPLYQLTGARLIAEAGNYQDALATAQFVLARPEQPPLLRAQAAMLVGDFLRDGPGHDCVAALGRHEQAIEVALPLATSDHPDERRAAKRLLIDAHLAVAHDIARGNWKDKPQTVTKWFDRAQSLVNELLASEGGDTALGFEVACQKLDAYAWLDGAIDPTAALAKAREAAEEILPQALDETYRRHITWELGKALVNAVDIERSRRNTVQALTYGKSAEQILNKLTATTWNSGRTHFQSTRLSFLMGSIHAVQLKNHTAAVVWFEKALDDVSRPEPDADLVQTADRGEWMVSMGVSYWAVGHKQKAIRLTELGAGLIEAAHREKAASVKKLAVPYNNLVFMHKQLGENDKARHFAELAARLEETKQR